MRPSDCSFIRDGSRSEKWASFRAQLGHLGGHRGRVERRETGGRRPRRAWACGVFALTLLPGVAAAGDAAALLPVEVASVRYTNVRPPNGATGNWLEADIALTVRPVAGVSAQMLSRVRVSLLVSFELPAPAGGERRLEYYRAEAECPALEPGRADVRFYLPPEIVKRDRLHGDPKYWGVELRVEGKPVTAGRAAYATALASPEQRKNFQKRAGAAAAPNDGILLPQYLTPFANEYPRATPSFVRKETR